MQTSAKFDLGAVQKNAHHVNRFGFVFFCSPGAPRRLQTTHGPENAVALLENLLFHERNAFYLYLSSANLAKSAKIGMRWLGTLPNVDPTLTER